MTITIFLLVLMSCSSYCMHREPIQRSSDEKTPLLIKVPKEKKQLQPAQATIAQYRDAVPNYLDRLPTEVRFNLCLYLKPTAPGLELLLQKLSLNQNQAEELYKKFYVCDRTNLLLELVKNENALKRIKKIHKQQQKKIACIARRAKSIIKEQDAGKMLTFMSENALPLETLEALTIETLPTVQEKVATGKEITGNVEIFIDRRETLSKISSTMGKLHTPNTVCAINFTCVPIALIVLAVLGLCNTHWPLDSFDTTQCWEDQSGGCFWRLNGTINNLNNCTKIINQTLLEICCNNYANSYCNSWHHNTTREFHRENLITWTPFIVTGSAYLLLQLMAFIIARSRNCCAVDSQTKQVIERYQNKIQELRIEEV